MFISFSILRYFLEYSRIIFEHSRCVEFYGVSTGKHLPKFRRSVKPWPSPPCNKKKRLKPLTPKEERTRFFVMIGPDPTKRNGVAFQTSWVIINKAVRISYLATNTSLKTSFLLNLSDISTKIYIVTVIVYMHVRMYRYTFVWINK